MATIAEQVSGPPDRPDALSGTPRAHAIDRWIFVFMAAWFIVIVLIGFIPDSLLRIAAVEAGQRPPFPMATHAHAVLMGSFLLVLLAQTWLVATGRCALHMQLGVLGMALAAALIIAGFILAPTNYQAAWHGANFGPPAMREAMAPWVLALENILLLQIRLGILFALFLTIALRARGADAGLHKRMMILATVVPLEAAFARMTWLPTTMPASSLSVNVWVLVAVAPMFAWDMIRNRSVHRAYGIWFAFFAATFLIVQLAWDTPWWHATARQLMGV
jgi:hypothetical protein